MKKLFVMAISLILIFCIAGCNNSDSSTASSRASKNNSVPYSSKNGVTGSCTHQWSNATCTTPQKCKKCGISQGSALGHQWLNATCTAPQKCQKCSATQGSALGHQYSNGYCIRCNAKDPNYVEYGTIKGTVTYKYNKYVGNRGDSGAIVMLFPNMSNYNTKKYDNSRACLGIQGDYESGIKVIKCDGNGNYSFDNVPVGRYYMLIISKETTDGSAFENKASRESLIKGNFSTLLSESDIKKLILTVGYNKIDTENIDVLANRTHTISKDFGITYI